MMKKKVLMKISRGIELRLERTEERLRAQFSALDSLLAQLNSTSTFLTQQLENLPLNNILSSQR